MTAESPLTAMTMGSCTLRLLADPAGFGIVRRIVGVYLRIWGRGHLEEVAATCVTELLTNVHRHVTSPECELTLRNLPEGVRAYVRDSSPMPPVVTHPDWRSESGRGMWLLTNMADCWGVLPIDDGKLVWVLLRDAS